MIWNIHHQGLQWNWFIFFYSFSISNYKLLSLSCWLRYKSALSLLNKKMKVVKICVKNDMYLMNYEFRVVGSRRFFLSKFLRNYWYTIVLKGVRIKLLKEIKYVLVECTSLLKLPIKMKGCLVMIYTQVHISESEEINKYSMFKWRLLVIKKLTST